MAPKGLSVLLLFVDGSKPESPAQFVFCVFYRISCKPHQPVQLQLKKETTLVCPHTFDSPKADAVSKAGVYLRLGRSLNTCVG